MEFGAGKAIALVAVGAFTAFVHGSMPSAPGAPQDDAFVPRPEVAHVSAFGYDAVVADYYWLQAVQIVGSVMDIEAKGPLLGALIDVVTTLDPWVGHPYRFAAVWLTGDLDNVRKANELLRRGIEYHPDDWRNRFYLGFNLFFYLDQYEEAAAVLEEAMELPDAPLYLRRLVARLKGKAESLELAETFLHALMLEAQSDDERMQYGMALDEIATERLARQLDAARERYVERHGRDIESVDDLVRGPDPVLPALPPEPSGGGWTLDVYTKRIVSDVLKHRYEAKVDEVNKKKIDRKRAEREAAT
jgi:tetratricopeptide (TPR) repeat protein